MLPLDGHMFVCFLLVMLHLLNYLPKLFNYDHNSLIIQSSQFVLIMPMNFLPEHLMIFFMSLGITIEHPVAHVHTQNGLAESFIKRLQLMTRPLLMRTKLSVSTWRHTILHAFTVVLNRPSAYHKHSPLQLAFGQPPNLSHFVSFWLCCVCPNCTPQRTKIGP